MSIIYRIVAFSKTKIFLFFFEMLCFLNFLLDFIKGFNLEQSVSSSEDWISSSSPLALTLWANLSLVLPSYTNCIDYLILYMNVFFNTNNTSNRCIFDKMFNISHEVFRIRNWGINPSMRKRREFGLEIFSK